jgi:hypothetical protein
MSATHFALPFRQSQSQLRTHRGQEYSINHFVTLSCTLAGDHSGVIRFNSWFWKPVFKFSKSIQSELLERLQQDKINTFFKSWAGNHLKGGNLLFDLTGQRKYQGCKECVDECKINRLYDFLSV